LWTIQDFKCNKVLPRGWKSTFLTKINAPTTPSQFRPISLCNNSYKIISKVSANGLKKVLPKIICMEQGAFVKGREILDNILLPQEVFHTIGNRSRGAKLMALKLDMERA